MTIGASALLYIFNYALIRYYEGYPWKDTWYGRVRTLHYPKKYFAAIDRINGVRTLLRATRLNRDSLQDGAASRRFAEILWHWRTFRSGADVVPVVKRFPLICYSPPGGKDSSARPGYAFKASKP